MRQAHVTEEADKHCKNNLPIRWPYCIRARVRLRVAYSHGVMAGANDIAKQIVGSSNLEVVVSLFSLKWVFSFYYTFVFAKTNGSTSSRTSINTAYELSLLQWISGLVIRLCPLKKWKPTVFGPHTRLCFYTRKSKIALKTGKDGWMGRARYRFTCRAITLFACALKFFW